MDKEFLYVMTKEGTADGILFSYQTQGRKPPMKVWTQREIVPYDTKRGKVEKEVDVTDVDTRIHIFRGNGGYKLSIMDNKGHLRHLTLGELAWVVRKINAIIEYGV